MGTGVELCAVQRKRGLKPQTYCQGPQCETHNENTNCTRPPTQARAPVCCRSWDGGGGEGRAGEGRGREGGKLERGEGRKWEGAGAVGRDGRLSLGPNFMVSVLQIILALQLLF